MEASGAERLLFELSGWGVEVSVALGADSRAERLAYRAGGEAREFSGDEVAVAGSDIGTLATVVLESGAADLPPVRLTLVLPVVTAGAENEFSVQVAAVRTTQRSLFGGPRAGPQHSYATLTLEGTVSVEQAQAPGGECRDWSAIHDLEPPGGRLVVSAICTVARAGFMVELRRHEPQGINPEDLLLDKVVQAAPGPSAAVLSEVPVRYEEQTEFRYRTVTILPDGPTLDVQRAV